MKNEILLWQMTRANWGLIHLLEWTKPDQLYNWSLVEKQARNFRGTNSWELVKILPKLEYRSCVGRKAEIKQKVEQENLKLIRESFDFVSWAKRVEA